MNIKVGPIQIFVSNIKRAEKWYSEILGMRVVKRFPHVDCVLMKLDNVEFDIGTPSSKWGQGWETVKIGGRTPIFFETDEIEKIVAKFKMKKIKFIEEVSIRPWGEKKAVFADPDGNEFNLIQPEE